MLSSLSWPCRRSRTRPGLPCPRVPRCRSARSGRSHQRCAARVPAGAAKHGAACQIGEKGSAARLCLLEGCFSCAHQMMHSGHPVGISWQTLHNSTTQKQKIVVVLWFRSPAQDAAYLEAEYTSSYGSIVPGPSSPMTSPTAHRPSSTRGVPGPG